MAGLKSGSTKVQEICDSLWNQTLVPATEEAKNIIAEANKKALEIIRQAKAESEEMKKKAEISCEAREKSCEYHLQKTFKAILKRLRDAIENELIHPALASLVAKASAQPKVIAEMIGAVIGGIAKEKSIKDAPTVFIPASAGVDDLSEQVAALVGAEIMKKLKKESLVLADIEGGIRVTLEKDHLSFDLSDETLTEMFLQYLEHEDFAEYFFAQTQNKGN